MDHDRSACARRKGSLKRAAIRAALGKHRVREKMGRVYRVRMSGEEIHFIGKIIRTEVSTTDIFHTRTHTQGMSRIKAPDGSSDQASPIDRHGIGSVAPSNPEWGLIGLIPGQDGWFALVSPGQLSSVVCL